MTKINLIYPLKDVIYHVLYESGLINGEQLQPTNFHSSDKVDYLFLLTVLNWSYGLLKISYAEIFVHGA